MRASSYLLITPLAALLAAPLAACGDDATVLPTTASSGSAARVEVARAAAGLRLTNVGTAPLAFLVVERNFAALANFALCADPGPSCVRLAAGQTVAVPFTEIGGYSSGAREVIVHTWRVVPNAGGGYRAADIASVVVTL